MKYLKEVHFRVKLQAEGKYYRLYITHKDLKGRLKKRIGIDDPDKLNALRYQLEVDINKKFINTVSGNELEAFIDCFIAAKIKRTATIFDYFNEFMEKKNNAINNFTRNKLRKSTLTSYVSAQREFEGYLRKNHIMPFPSNINKDVLDNFYCSLHGGKNYRVKIHRRTKAFIKYLDTIVGLSIPSSYKNSSFSEQYDNQMPEEDDKALEEDHVRALITLRRKLLRGEFEFATPTINTKFPEDIMVKQNLKHRNNLIRTLDCYLFMISTGQYHKDILNAKINFTLDKDKSCPTISYRRSKNDSLCNCIPFADDDIFIPKEIIAQYSIKPGSNFPLNLSNTHFNKCLKEIAEMAGLDIKLNNKMARKTFATIWCERGLSQRLLQKILGHKDPRQTAHYLRMLESDLAEEIYKHFPKAQAVPMGI